MGGMEREDSGGRERRRHLSAYLETLSHSKVPLEGTQDLHGGSGPAAPDHPLLRTQS